MNVRHQDAVLNAGDALLDVFKSLAQNSSNVSRRFFKGLHLAFFGLLAFESLFMSFFSNVSLQEKVENKKYSI